MEIKTGQIWNHWKNREHTYKIICVGRDSETLEEIIVYKILYESETGMGEYWVRPKKMFLEEIERNGKKMQRFSLVKE